MISDLGKPQLVVNNPCCRAEENTQARAIRSDYRGLTKIDKTKGGLDPFSKGRSKCQPDRRLQ
ncbi:hypothetical protein PtB15_15B413 [Puccinia triticina]|nr:hypothetical protein PtB15_15B413 [Puccinia triticina]